MAHGGVLLLLLLLRGAVPAAAQHEVWHEGDADRYVLYMSVWKPLFGTPSPNTKQPFWTAAERPPAHQRRKQAGQSKTTAEVDISSFL